MRAVPTTAALLSLLFTAAPGPAQVPAQQPTQPAVPVFGVESAVVLLDVVVRDKRGHLVRDLKASDFEVFEDGQKQGLEGFRVVDRGVDFLPSAAAAQPGAGASTAAAPAPAEPATSGAPTAGAGPSPGVIAFLFDRLSPDGRDNAYKAAVAYATRGHVDGDVVAVFNVDLALRTLQPFTTNLDAVKVAFDRARAQGQTAILNTREEERSFNSDAERLERTLTMMGGTGGTDGNVAAQAANLATQREFALLQSGVLRSFDRLERDQQGFASTNGLLALVSGLKSLPGRKTLVFFSEGLTLTANVLKEFRSVIATANRANVSVYTVDVGGLRTHSGTQEARDDLVAHAKARLAQEGRGYLTGEDRAITQGQERAEDMLRENPKAGLGQLAEETGGFMVADTNDTGKGFQRIQEEMRFHYLLSYAPTDSTFDGRYRAVTVKLLKPGLEVHSRKGYFAVKPGGSVPVRAFETPALAELDKQPAPNSFPLGAIALSFPEPNRPGRVPVMVQLPATALAFTPDKTGKVYTADFSIVARVRDAQGREVDRLSRNYPLTVAADRVEAAKHGDVLYFQETDLRPGRYTLDTVAYDSVSKKASVRSATIEVPAAAGDGDLRLSSVVLLQRAEKLPAAEQGKDNPLHFGEMILYPNMGTPFRKSQAPTLGFYFVAYGGTAAPPRQALIELMKGDAVTAKLPLPLPAPDTNGRIQHAATLPIGSLAPGEYALRLTVGAGPRSASRQAGFVVAE